MENPRLEGIYRWSNTDFDTVSLGTRIRHYISLTVLDSSPFANGATFVAFELAMRAMA
jgi:hypothetical protein